MILANSPQTPHSGALHVEWENIGEAQISLPHTREWLDYWRYLAGDTACPNRQSLSLIADRPRLASLAVWVEVLEDDYLYRVAGEEVTRQFGLSLKGKRFSEIDFQGAGPLIRALYEQAILLRAPMITRGFYQFEKERRARWEATCMPFLGSEDTVSNLLIGTSFATVRQKPGS